MLYVLATRTGLPRLHVPEAQGGLPSRPMPCTYRGTRASLGRTVRAAYRGTPGKGKGKGKPLRLAAWLERAAAD